jgi:hypothetical protein
VSRRAAVRLLPLLCPGCGRDLPALDEDVAFCCPACPRGLESDGDRLRERPLRALAAPASRAIFHLPFWSFPPSVRVPAFNTRDILPLLCRFSGRDLPEGRASVRVLVGARLASAEAWRAARFAEVAPPGEPPGEATLLAVPFLDEGNRLLDAATGAVLYKETIDRADEILAAARP